MKVLFLDVDGVLNGWGGCPCNDYGQNDARTDHMMCSVLATRIQRLCEKADLKIVVSSSWRNSRSQAEMAQLFRGCGITAEVVGMTPTFAVMTGPPGTRELFANRGEECMAWLNRRSAGEIDNFVIFDDMGEKQFPSVLDHLVQTDGYVGVHDHDIDKAIALLGVR
jgi:hypothetical protein